MGGLKIMGPNWHPSVASASLNALAGPPIWYCGSQALSETRQSEQSRNTPQTNSLETRFVEQRETKLKHEVGDLTDEVGMFGRGTHTMRAGMPPCKECGGQGRTKKCFKPQSKRGRIRSDRKIISVDAGKIEVAYQTRFAALCQRHILTQKIVPETL